MNAKTLQQDGVPLQTLNILPANFVIQDVSHLICRDFLSRGTFVNTVEKVSIPSKW